MKQEDVSASVSLVIDTFHSLRSDLLAVFGNVQFTRKGDYSPVTEWDVRVENAVHDALRRAFPDLGFEGEETGAQGSRERYWLVDPIDGTSSFIRGLHYSTNMAALIENGETIAAVIYDFVMDVTYTAIKGGGAFKDGRPIHVNDDRQPGNLVMYSFSREIFGHVREAANELGIRALLPMGGAGHTYAMLAEGKIDGAVALRTGMGAYDNAPGVLLAEEAGAVLLQYDDESGVNRHEFIIGTKILTDAIEQSGLI
jgi:myo-inositol-1(or 4)-monophosphatase